MNNNELLIDNQPFKVVFVTGPTSVPGYLGNVRRDVAASVAQESANQQMPLVMDGFEMLDELRTRPEHRSIPVLVLTAKTLTDDDRRRLNGNVERIIEKAQHSTEEVFTYVRNVLAEAD